MDQLIYAPLFQHLLFLRYSMYVCTYDIWYVCMYDVCMHAFMHIVSMNVYSALSAEYCCGIGV